MGEVLATALAPIAIVALVLLVLRGRRCLSFDATLRRYHPELVAQLDIEHHQLGAVAARAVNVRTTPAPRELAGLEVV